MNCFYHPDREAVNTCSRCGQAICNVCNYITGTQPICLSCWEKHPPPIQKDTKTEDEKTVKPKVKLTLANKIAAAIVLVVLAIFGTCAICICTAPSEESTQVDLNASIRFDGSQFIIANNDSFDWLDVEFELNSAGLSSGFTLTHPLIEAGATYTVGAMQFAKPDGTRFNPFLMKPQKMSVSCETPDGKDGWYFAEWK